MAIALAFGAEIYMPLDYESQPWQDIFRISVHWKNEGEGLDLKLSIPRSDVVAFTMTSCSVVQRRVSSDKGEKQKILSC